jgi:hypothetical protein
LLIIDVDPSGLDSDPTPRKTKSCAHFSRVRELCKVNRYYGVITLCDHREGSASIVGALGGVL